MHSQDIFTELSLVLVVVAAISVIMRLLKQPLILGYILAGVIVGPIFLDIIHAKEAFEGFSEIGIALLLFIIGLGMNASVIKSLGKVSVVTAAVIFGTVGALGILAMYLFGFDIQTALVMGVALFFSSTIVILKVLSDKREISRLHGQIAIGVILVDDIVATLAMVAIATASSGGLTPSELLPMLLKAIGLGGLLYLMGAYVVPKFSKMLAKSQELLFVFAVSWGFGVASLFGAAGFSHEVGALFAGVSLASLPYAMEMGTRLKPLRDFFVVLFFVSLGEGFVFNDMGATIAPAIVLSVIVLLGKPIVTMASLGALGYTKLTSFKAGIHLSQISEFSIVLIILAVQTELIDAQASSIVTLVAIITISLSTYLMKYDEKIFRKLHKVLSIFERKKPKEISQKRGLYTAILFGYHHGGHEFLQLFRDMKQRYLVVDYNPEIIEHLETQGVRHAYGDATDSEFLEEINAGHAKFVASTIIDRRVNLLILSYLHRHANKAVFICHARTYEDALELYNHGAAYVILPRFLGSDYITTHIKRHGMDEKAFDKFRAKHIVSIGRAAVHTESR